jgi:ATP-dependent exoDNAse (exonuclease V) beta subunit
VHAIVAQAPLDGSDAELSDVALLEARLLDIDEGLVMAAVDAVRRFLSHDLGRRAARAETRRACRREAPVTCRMVDGTLVEGFVDLAFEEDGRWTVLDFKTDRVWDGAAEAGYRRQVAVYGEAVARATESDVAAILVRL